MVGVAKGEKNRESLCLWYWVVAMRLAGICFGVSLVCLVSLVSLGGHGALAGTWQSPCCWVWALDGLLAGCWLLAAVAPAGERGCCRALEKALMQLRTALEHSKTCHSVHGCLVVTGMQTWMGCHCPLRPRIIFK